MNRILVVLEMIKVQHSVFALPFAAVGACYAARGLPPAWTTTWIVVAMVAARSAAMIFNRIVDAGFDAKNPRTKDRAIPGGLVSVPFARACLAVSIALFVASAAMLNWTVLALSPVALAVIFAYSYTKRFTPLSHFVLGLSLAIAPIGAWLAVKPALSAFPLVIGGAVLCWVAGFDILYACQDVAFDRASGLRSIPAWLGVKRSLRVARACHFVTVGLLGLAVPAADLGGWYVAGIAGIAVLLAYEHALVRPDDLARVNRAFFHVNAAVSMTIGVAALMDLFLKR